MIDLLPLLGPVGVGIWVMTVYNQCVETLKTVYKNEGIAMPTALEHGSVNAWAVLRPFPQDSAVIIQEKARLRAEAKRRLRFSVVIFFGSAILLIITSNIL